MLERDFLQFGKLADDGRDIGEAVGADHQFLEVLQLSNLFGQRIEAVAEEIERLGIGIGLDFFHQLLGVAVGDADFFLALRLGVAANKQKGGSDKDDECLSHGCNVFMVL